MPKFSLQHQLIAAFSALALLVLIVGAIGAFGSRTLGEVFTEYRASARDSLSVNALKIDLVQARTAAFQWRADGDPQRAEEFQYNINAAVRDAGAVGMTEVAELAGEYEAAFNAAQTHQQDRQRQFDAIADLGPAIRRNLSEVIRTAYADGDPEAAYFGAIAQEKLLLGRFYAERFLVDNALTTADRARLELDAAREALQTLLPLLQNPVRRDLTTEAISGLDAYRRGFDGIVAAIGARNAQLDRMDEIGPVMAELSENRRLDIVDRQNTLGPQGAAAADSTQTIVIIAAGVAVVLAALLAFFLARGISGAIKRIVREMDQLSGGDKTIDISGTNRSDEIGDMARALLVFRDNAREVDRLQEEQKETEARALQSRRAAREKLADDFEAEVGAVIESLSHASDSLQDKSRTLNASVDAAGQRSSSVAAAAEEASTNVESVASAAEELTASIREVASQVAASSEAARTSNAQAAKSNEQLDRLNTAVAGVDEIVKSINEVAEQTNLLALNATIEAARAGEAGKGFAVVAEEVKQLAEQTQKLTEEIAKRLSEIGASSNDAIASTRDIIKQINEIDATTAALAAAVEEQSSATGEISASAQQAATGAQAVSADIAGVQTSVDDSAGVANTVDEAASVLKTDADRLRSKVTEFLNSVRAA